MRAARLLTTRGYRFVSPFFPFLFLGLLVTLLQPRLSSEWSPIEIGALILGAAYSVARIQKIRVPNRSAIKIAWMVSLPLQVLLVITATR